MNATCPGSTELRARFCSTRHAAQSSPHENKELTSRILRREVASNTSILNFDWTFVHGANVGYVLLFFTVFSFVMTVAAPFMLFVLRLFLKGVMRLLLTLAPRLTDWYFKNEDGVPSGRVRTSQLRDFALSNKENFFLLDLVEKQEQAAAS